MQTFNKFSVSGYIKAGLPMFEVHRRLVRAFHDYELDFSNIRLLPYTERQTFMVLVPRGGPETVSIAPASGIVGRWKDSDVEVYYEGAVHQQNMSFEDRLFHAASRCVTRYPTSSKGLWQMSSFIQVGTFAFNDDWTDKRLHITDQETLDRWLA